MRIVSALTLGLTLAGSGLWAERLANGLEFRAPAGWTVRSNEQAAMLIPPDQAMESDGKNPSEIYLVTLLPGVKDLQDPRLASIVKGQYFPAQAQVRPVAAAQTFQAAGGAGYLYCFEGVSEGVMLGMQIYVAGLSGGGVAGVAAIARPTLLTRREAAIAAVAASLNRPAAAPAAIPGGSAAAGPWDQRLRGRTLHLFSSYSSGYGSGGYNSHTTLRLAADGSYQFQRAGSVSVYVDGASGGSASQSGEQGRWRIGEQGGKAVLELVSSAGRTQSITLTTEGGKTFLNGRRWLVGD